MDSETLAYLEGRMAQGRQLGLEYVAPSALIFWFDCKRIAWAKGRDEAVFEDGQEGSTIGLGGQLPWVTLQGLRHGHATHLLEAAI